MSTQTYNQGGFYGFAKNVYRAGRRAYEAVKPYAKIIGAFIIELNNEKYNISMKDVGPETEKLLMFIEKYRLDKLHEIIRDADWTITAPYQHIPYLDLKLIVGEPIDPQLVDEIVESLQEYGQVSHNIETYGDNYIEQFMVLGNRTRLDEVFEGLKMLDKAYHKGQFNYVYSSAWDNEHY